MTSPTQKKKGNSLLTCPYRDKCGGCDYSGIPYQEQLVIKKKMIEDLFPNHRVENVLGMEDPYHYRHKVQASFRFDKGKILSGTYEAGSHRLVNMDQCLLDEAGCDAIIKDIRNLCQKFKLSIFDERSGRGTLRHVLIRKGFATGEYMVVLVTGSYEFPGKASFQKELRRLHPEITSIVQNINGKFGSMVLGEKTQPIYGLEFIYDKILGKTFRISPRAFYQVNPQQTEVLYSKALEMADIQGETVLDAYSGTGTIGILASSYAKSVIGVELNQDAVKDAISNAKRNQISNIQFVCQDAGEYLISHEVPEVVIMDPPRSGSSEAFLNAILAAKPNKVVYISCNPVTQKRDVEILEKGGYQVKTIQPVDLFPLTKHVETVVQLSKGNVSSQNVKVEFSLEDMDMSGFRQGATYEQIQAWVQEKYGFHVTHLNIAKTKRKCGIIERENHNHPKSEDSRSPKTPKEKEEAIMEAFKHFQMI